jgi:hypothetical protein
MARAEVMATSPLTPADRQKEFLFLLRQSLWGNRSDLSLYAGDVQAASAAALSAQGEWAQANVLVDDGVRAWGVLKGAGRVDIVLDNAGIEVFVDLCLADWLITSGTAQQVIVHAKPIPWFVSDVTPNDFEWLLTQMEADSEAGISKLAVRWRTHLKEERWVVRTNWFWCSPCPYWHMQSVAPSLYADLALSCLIVFKGDLNYRKLIFDAIWPYDTPFATAIGPFAPAPFLALRTNKANTIAGLRKGQGESLDSNALRTASHSTVRASNYDTITLRQSHRNPTLGAEKDWLTSGRFGVMQLYVPLV